MRLIKYNILYFETNIAPLQIAPKITFVTIHMIVMFSLISIVKVRKNRFLTTTAETLKLKYT